MKTKLTDYSNGNYSSAEKKQEAIILLACQASWKAMSFETKKDILDWIDTWPNEY